MQGKYHLMEIFNFYTPFRAIALFLITMILALPLSAQNGSLYRSLMDAGIDLLEEQEFFKARNKFLLIMTNAYVDTEFQGAMRRLKKDSVELLFERADSLLQDDIIQQRDRAIWERDRANAAERRILAAFTAFRAEQLHKNQPPDSIGLKLAYAAFRVDTQQVYVQNVLNTIAYGYFSSELSTHTIAHYHSDTTILLNDKEGNIHITNLSAGTLHKIPMTTSKTIQEMEFHPGYKDYFLVRFNDGQSLYLSNGDPDNGLILKHGETIISGFFNDRSVYSFSSSGLLKEWSLDGKLLSETQLLEGITLTEVRQLNTDLFALSLDDQSMMVVNVHSLDRPLAFFKPHSAPLNGIWLSKNRKEILSSAREAKVKIWALNGEIQEEIQLGTIAKKAVWAAGDSLVICLDFDGSIDLHKRFSKGSLTLNKLLAEPEDKIIDFELLHSQRRIIAWTVQGKLLILSYEGNILQKVQAHQASINQSIVLEKEGLFISASRDRSVKLWNLEGEVLWDVNFDHPIEKLETAPNKGYLLIKLTSGKVINTPLPKQTLTFLENLALNLSKEEKEAFQLNLSQQTN